MPVKSASLGPHVESHYWAQGLVHVAGLDEVGRGALAGPVVAAAVVFPPNFCPQGVRIADSKALSPNQRQRAYDYIVTHALAFAVGRVEADTIDRINILQATLESMRLAVEGLSLSPDICLVDGHQRAPLACPQETLVGGDAKVLSIAAASIVAKVTRDRWMILQDTYYPHFGFKQHKGYGTAQHLQAIATYGQSPLHRQSFIHT